MLGVPVRILCLLLAPLLLLRSPQALGVSPWGGPVHGLSGLGHGLLGDRPTRGLAAGAAVQRVGSPRPSGPDVTGLALLSVRGARCVLPGRSGAGASLSGRPLWASLCEAEDVRLNLSWLGFRARTRATSYEWMGVGLCVSCSCPVRCPRRAPEKKNKKWGWRGPRGANVA